MENNQKQHVLKKDKYVRSRGGNSHFLDIYCSNCNEHLLLYQKDGKGSLIRLYIDRIFDPLELAKLQIKCKTKTEMPNLQCLKCKTVVGVPMVYQLENRLAFNLVRGRFVKKKSEGKYPPIIKKF